MTRLGKFVTPQELNRVVAERDRSGMWLGDGTPLGDPAYEVLQLARKYGLPENTGLDLRSGEFISQEMPADPYESVEYEQFVESMAQHCHCEPPERRPCDGVLAGGICDGAKEEPENYEDREDDDDNL